MRSRKTLIRLLDAKVSQIVIARDGACVQCGSTDQLTCGHLFSRRLFATRWDLDNCHTQCWPCNFRHSHYPDYYVSWFLKEYGKAKYLKLAQKAHKIALFSTGYLEELLMNLSSSDRGIGG
jgi:5-methylcytosine-specific restriction endonuclease McrA